MSTKFPSVLITGANRGIGFHLVKAIRNRLKPQIIFATYRDPTKSEELLELATASKDIHAIQLDVQDYSKHEAVRKEVASASPGGLSLLINNAGVTVKAKRFEEFLPDELRNVMEINLIAPLALTKALLPELVKATQTTNSTAAVVNISSSMGSIATNEIGGFYAYRCSKAALNAATKSMSLDLRNSKILSVAVHPGWVKTDMGGPRAPLSPEESAAGITNVLLDLDESHSGKFISYDGKELPW